MATVMSFVFQRKIEVSATERVNLNLIGEMTALFIIFAIVKIIITFSQKSLLLVTSISWKLHQFSKYMHKSKHFTYLSLFLFVSAWHYLLVVSSSVLSVFYLQKINISNNIFQTNHLTSCNSWKWHWQCFANFKQVL